MFLCGEKQWPFIDLLIGGDVPVLGPFGAGRERAMNAAGQFLSVKMM